jgi:hypothetical protein
MNIINTISNKRFSVNCIEYLKNYVSRVAGDKVEIFNNYERSDVLVALQHYSDFRVDGIVYNSATALQSALLPVIFSRGTLGNDVAEINQDNKVRTIPLFIAMDETSQNVAERINELEPFTVTDTEIIIFDCTGLIDYFNSRQVRYLLCGAGKGTYGEGGTPLGAENLVKIFEEGGSAGAAASPTTKTVYFTIIGNQTISQWLNTQNPAITIQAQNEGYTVFKGMANGNSVSYLWLGNAGIFGLGRLQSTDNDLQLLDDTAQVVVRPVFKNFFLAPEQSAQIPNVANILSTGNGLQFNITAGLPITVNSLDAPVIIQVQENIQGAITIYTYLFTGGAGSWGYRGSYINFLSLKLLGTRVLTILDIDTDPNTVTLDLGEIADGNFITAANAEARDFTGTDKVYYIVFINNNINYTHRFVGMPGTYGGSGNTNFTNEMFATGPTNETPPVPTMDQVNRAGSIITDQDTGWLSGVKTFVARGLGMIFKNNEKSLHIVSEDINRNAPNDVTLTIPAKLEDDTFAMASDLNEYVPYTGALRSVNLGAQNIYSGTVGAGYGTLGLTASPALLAVRNPSIPPSGNVSNVFSIHSSGNQRGLHSYEDDQGKLNLNNRGGANAGYITNTAFGVQALSNLISNGSVPTGLHTIAIGYRSLNSLRYGNNNFAIGVGAGEALDDEVTANVANNTFVGNYAGRLLKKGYNNTIIGRGKNTGDDPTEMYSSTIVGSNISYSNEELTTPPVGLVIIANGFGIRAFEKNSTGAINLKGISAALNGYYFPLILKYDVSDSITITGTTLEAIVSRYEIPANTLSNGKLEIDGKFLFTGGGGTRIIKYYVSTTNSFAGALFIGQCLCANNILFTKFSRDYCIRPGNTLYGYTAAFNLPVLSSSSSVIPLSVTFNPAVQYYLIVTVQLANSADSAVQKELELTFKKS